jgi:hypothetical protein
MKQYLTLQPAEFTDFITEDGHELKKLPYPFYVHEDGRIDRQDFWRGTVSRVIGFQADYNRMTIDLFWDDAVKNPESAVGKFVVTADARGKWSVHGNAISSVEVTELEERYTVEGQGVIGTGETLEDAKKDFKKWGGKLSEGYQATHYLGSFEPEVTTKKARATSA